MARNATRAAHCPASSRHLLSHSLSPPFCSLLHLLRAASLRPRASVDFFYCVNNDGCSNGEAAYFLDQVVSNAAPGAAAVNCVGGACHGEGAWTDPDGFTQMVSRAIANLAPTAVSRAVQ